MDSHEHISEALLETGVLVASSEFRSWVQQSFDEMMLYCDSLHRLECACISEQSFEGLQSLILVVVANLKM